MFVAENELLRKEMQKLRDENNILKGPQVKPCTRKQSTSDHSSKREFCLSSHKKDPLMLGKM